MGRPVIAIAGPTASGKSAVADALAERLSVPVISCDAMQIYRGMDIGTAKTPEAERRVPLLGVDLAEPTEEYSAALFQRTIRGFVDGLLEEDRQPVLCGGTGLYLDAVVDEMDFPEGTLESDARRKYQAYLDANGAQALWELLRETDPASAEAIHPHNTRRVIRALEMAEEGVSYAEQKAGLTRRAPHYDLRLYALTMDRERLYGRINRRVDEMLAEGWLDEVRGLRECGFSSDSTAGQAIGYKELLSVLEGTMNLDEAAEAVKTRTRRYAKRQLSWLRRDGRARWLDMDELTSDEAVQTILTEQHLI